MADSADPNLRPPLPDVVSDVRSTLRGALDWVGMDRIVLPVRAIAGTADAPLLSARVSAWVNLAGAEDRGIHMSRLYRVLDEQLAGKVADGARLRDVLGAFLASHAGLSDRARLRLAFELPVRRRALRSGLSGWRGYPVQLEAVLDSQGFSLETQVQVEYSSTCPGSAALARQLIQQQFEQDFAPGDPPRAALHEWLGSARGILATPHAQRSVATVRVRAADGGEADPLALIDNVEAVLGTPVQTAVKREDEQEFARLNGVNPMYCEDAARRIRAALERDRGLADYSIRVAHLESLHPHDAVAMTVRGVPGGFVAMPD